MSLPAQVNNPRSGEVANGNENVNNVAAAAAEEVIFVTAGYDHTIKYWQAHTGKCRRTLQHTDSQVNALEISPDGQLLAAAGYQHIRMFDVHCSGAGPVVNYEGVSKNVMAVGFHGASKWMYTGGEDGTAKIWDLRMRNLHCQCAFTAAAPINSVVLHPNQHELIVGDQSGTISMWDMRANVSESFVPEPGASIHCVAVDPQGCYIASVTNKGNAFVSLCKQGENVSGNGGAAPETTSPSRLKPIKKIKAHNRYALRCKFTPDSSMLVTSSADQTCRVWRTTDFELVSEITAANQRWVWDLAFSADSQYLFTASSDSMARLWSLPNEANNFTYDLKRVYEENGHQKAVTCLAFRDGSGLG